jgi:hypothetical protein
VLRSGLTYEEAVAEVRDRPLTSSLVLHLEVVLPSVKFGLSEVVPGAFISMDRRDAIARTTFLLALDKVYRAVMTQAGPEGMRLARWAGSCGVLTFAAYEAPDLPYTKREFLAEEVAIHGEC